MSIDECKKYLVALDQKIVDEHREEIEKELEAYTKTVVCEDRT